MGRKQTEEAEAIVEAEPHPRVPKARRESTSKLRKVAREYLELTAERSRR
jgi:hypothetical protein